MKNSELQQTHSIDEVPRPQLHSPNNCNIRIRRNRLKFHANFWLIIGRDELRRALHILNLKKSSCVRPLYDLSRDSYARSLIASTYLATIYRADIWHLTEMVEWSGREGMIEHEVGRLLLLAKPALLIVPDISVANLTLCETIVAIYNEQRMRNCKEKICSTTSSAHLT